MISNFIEPKILLTIDKSQKDNPVKLRSSNEWNFFQKKRDEREREREQVRERD